MNYMSYREEGWKDSWVSIERNKVLLDILKTLQQKRDASHEYKLHKSFRWNSHFMYWSGARFLESPENFSDPKSHS